MQTCVLSLAGNVLGMGMIVIIVAIGVGIIFGYTYKRSVASLLGVPQRREERYTKLNQIPLWHSYSPKK